MQVKMTHVIGFGFLMFMGIILAGMLIQISNTDIEGYVILIIVGLWFGVPMILLGLIFISTSYVRYLTKYFDFQQVLEYRKVIGPWYIASGLVALTVTAWLYYIVSKYGNPNL